MNKIEKMQVTDSVEVAMSRGRDLDEKIGVRTNVHVLLVDKDGNRKYEEWSENLVTDVGDSVLAKRLYDNATNIVTGMKLGTGSTAAAKNGAGAAMVTYVSGSQEALDATATDATKGAGLGWRTTFVCTWIAGDVTNSALREICLTNQTALADNTSAAAETVARYVMGAAVDKQATDQLVVTWRIDIQGS